MNIQSNYTCIPRTASISVNNNAKATTFAPKFRGLENDTVNFSRKYLSSHYARVEGACNLHILREGIDRDVCDKIPAMRKKTFTVEDYKTLSKDEKKYLREVISQEYYNTPSGVRREPVSSIRQDRDFFIKISKGIKKTLDKKYPDGWSFISLGGSPSVFAKTLEYMGEDVKELPFSYACTMYPGYANLDMAKYLDDIGLTNEYLNDGKKKILTDYVWSGRSLEKMKEIMQENDHYNENFRCVDLQKLLPDNISKKEKWKLNDFFFTEENIKSYSSCPSMNKPELYDKEKMDNEFGWNMSTKLMNFALIDYFENKKTIKGLLPSVLW